MRRRGKTNDHPGGRDQHVRVCGATSGSTTPRPNELQSDRRKIASEAQYPTDQVTAHSGDPARRPAPDDGSDFSMGPRSRRRSAQRSPRGGRAGPAGRQGPGSPWSLSATPRKPDIWKSKGLAVPGVGPAPTVRLPAETTEATLLSVVDLLNEDRVSTVQSTSCPCPSTSTSRTRSSPDFAGQRLDGSFTPQRGKGGWATRAFPPATPYGVQQI